MALGTAAAGVAVAVAAFLGEGKPTPTQPTQMVRGMVNGQIAFVSATQISEAPYDVHQGIWTFDLRSGEQVLLYQPPSGALLMGLSWSPDGASVAFTMLDDRFGPTRLYLMGAGEGEPQEIHSCEGTACMSSPAWKPDGTRIVFAEGSMVHTIAPDGSEKEVLANCQECTQIEGRVAWSPDGSRVAFGAIEPDGGSAMYVLDVESRSVKRITECDSAVCLGGLRDSSPTWAPDGSWIAFARERNIWRIRPDGTHLVKLTNCPDSYEFNSCTLGSPVWSPNGRSIAYQGTDGWYVMESDGGDPRRVADGTLLDWQPLGEEPGAEAG